MQLFTIRIQRPLSHKYYRLYAQSKEQAKQLAELRWCGRNGYAEVL